MPERPCIASWEAVEEFGDNCPLCGCACYAHEMEEDREARLAAASRETRRAHDELHGCWECGTSDMRGDVCAEHEQMREGTR